MSEATLTCAAEAAGLPEVVFHAAGGASVGASLTDPQRDRERTVGSLEQMLAFLRQRAPEARLIYPSSAAVYGSQAPLPTPEWELPAPISPYGMHKLEAEQVIAGAAQDFGLDAVIVRFFSIYGPGLRKQLLWELAGALLERPARLELSGTGDEARDFLFVDDAVALIELAAALPPQGEPLTLNGGAGIGVSVREIAEGLVAAMGGDTAITFSGVVRAGDPKRQIADISRARALGFEPKVPLAEGLARLVAWRLGLEGAGAY